MARQRKFGVTAVESTTKITRYPSLVICQAKGDPSGELECRQPISCHQSSARPRPIADMARESPPVLQHR